MIRLAKRLAAMLVIVLVLISLVWLYAEHRLGAGFDAWEANARASGWTVAHGAVTRGGWPLEARMLVAGFEVSGRSALVPGGFDWSAEHLTLTLTPFHPTGLLLYPEGTQHVRMAPLPGADLRADSMRLVLSSTGQEADIEVVQLSIDRIEGQGWSGIRLGAGNLSLFGDRTAKAGSTALGLRFTLADITLPREERWPVGDTVAHVSGAVSVDGPLPEVPDPGAWRDAGGAAYLHDLSCRWGLLGVTGDGRFTLDAHWQPQGEATLAVSGGTAALDELADGGAIAAREAVAAKAVLGLLGHGGGGGPVSLPFVLREGVVSLGGFPLARMPALPWQGG